MPPNFALKMIKLVSFMLYIFDCHTKENLKQIRKVITICGVWMAINSILSSLLRSIFGRINRIHM